MTALFLANVSKGLVQNIMIDSYGCCVFLAGKKKHTHTKKGGGASYPLNLIGLSGCFCIFRPVQLSAKKHEATFTLGFASTGYNLLPFGTVCS